MKWQTNRTLATMLAVTALCSCAIAAVVFCRDWTSGDPAAEWLEANRRRVDRMVLADVEKYGVDIYRLYLEVTQRMSGEPESDFGADKALKKLQISYPKSDICALVEACEAYGAVRRRDMLMIEKYLRGLERRHSDGPVQLMPSGYEIEPQLVAAQYNYFFHVGRYDEAEKTLDYLVSKFGDSWLFQPQGGSVSIESFAGLQRRILAVAGKEKSK